MVNKIKFENLLFNKAAEMVPGVSALRGTGEGTTQKTKSFLKKKLNRTVFCKYNFKSRKEFTSYLDTLTKKLCSKWIKSNCSNTSWGLSRKIINLYFREILYNFFLNKYISKYAKYLEVPLDSFVGKGLISDYKNYENNKYILPKRWVTIKSIDRKRNKSFQNAALIISKHYGLKRRVDLDIIYYRDIGKNNS